MQNTESQNSLEKFKMRDNVHQNTTDTKIHQQFSQFKVPKSRFLRSQSYGCLIIADFSRFAKMYKLEKLFSQYKSFVQVLRHYCPIGLPSEYAVAEFALGKDAFEAAKKFNHTLIHGKAIKIYLTIEKFDNGERVLMGGMIPPYKNFIQLKDGHVLLNDQINLPQ